MLYLLEGFGCYSRQGLLQYSRCKCVPYTSKYNIYGYCDRCFIAGFVFGEFMMYFGCFTTGSQRFVGWIGTLLVALRRVRERYGHRYLVYRFSAPHGGFGYHRPILISQATLSASCPLTLVLVAIVTEARSGKAADSVGTGWVMVFSCLTSCSMNNNWVYIAEQRKVYFGIQAACQAHRNHANAQRAQD